MYNVDHDELLTNPTVNTQSRSGLQQLISLTSPNARNPRLLSRHSNHNHHHNHYSPPIHVPCSCTSSAPSCSHLPQLTKSLILPYKRRAGPDHHQPSLSKRPPHLPTSTHPISCPQLAHNSPLLRPMRARSRLSTFLTSTTTVTMM
jgi:hypothetical protein